MMYCQRINEEVNLDRCNLCNEGNGPHGCDSNVRKHLLESSGVLIGKSPTEEKVVFDIWKPSNQPNMIVLGKLGTGRKFKCDNSKSK